MKTIAYIISTYHIGTYDLDIRDVLKSYITNLLEQLKNN